MENYRKWRSKIETSKMPSIYHEHCGKPGPKSTEYMPPPEARGFKSRSAPNSPCFERKPLFALSRSPRLPRSPRLVRSSTLQGERRQEKAKEIRAKSAKVNRSKSFQSKSEQKNSLGKVWHPSCLRCEECGKRLNPGQHSEHRGIPYCNLPCYSLLFGPGGYGHGGTESHKHLGEEKLSQAEQEAIRNEIVPRLKHYNTYFENRKALQMACREANGHLILEGVLRVYWGLKHPVMLSSTSMADWRRKRTMAGEGIAPVSNKKPTTAVQGLKENEIRPRTTTLERILARRKSITNRNIKEASSGEKKPEKFPPSYYASKTEERIVSCPESYYMNNWMDELRSISPDNYVTPPKTLFTPPYGTSTNLRLTSKTKTREVIKMLFAKYQISSNQKKFNLYAVYENGSTRALQDEESPLHCRLLLGPSEYAAKIYIMEAKEENSISHEVAQYIHFADPVLEAFLKKYAEEEEREIQRIKEWYALYREKLQEHLSEISTAV
ncbi:ras association domain-containing protein 2 isoform X1 [Nematostella vectensis]|uniref:ras association domain-containing protein 2 isoform X1 n=1 Tax=Nematostella vectensis TaxID=45351 RepID=UPI0020774A87|nr:ras association domain-containing protein 2 isoform X1 [Nematostella vectensis]